ncbi:EMYY motif lipoprotein [Macrococcus sp. DPC7161]|uniref:EMYY motif lipoprotein n=1 Tax=Macrococcus sp. DPC7161 TaxID=2507060 RepID=UPI0013E9452A|nr:EMYY motif lipoprotein [Macrococcus sp. DPC7161]
MKKYYLLFFVLLMTFYLVGCSNALKSDINDYKVQMKNVQKEEKKLVEQIDALHLEKIDQLIGSEVTEDKKKKLIHIEQKIDQEILPQYKKYESLVKKVKPKTKEVKDVHAMYLDNLKKKKKFIDTLSDYIHAFNDSIASNEEILEYTKIFEKNKALSEKFHAKAQKQSDESKDLATITEVINANSDDLKSKVGYLSDTHTVKEKTKYIDQTLIPLLKKQVDKLNKTNIKSKDVIGLRKATIEINYSLINYYKERKNAMKIEEQLQNVPIQNILENTKYIKSLDDKYYESLKNLES